MKKDGIFVSAKEKQVVAMVAYLEKPIAEQGHYNTVAADPREMMRTPATDLVMAPQPIGPPTEFMTE